MIASSIYGEHDGSGADVNEPNEPTRPKTVGDCRDGVRPCPWVSCRFNLLIDVSENGTITFNRPKVGNVAARISRTDSDLEFDAEADAAVDYWFGSERHVSSCVIDEVDDEQTLAQISNVLCTSREMVRQIELVAVKNLTKRVAVAMEARGVEDVASAEHE